METFHRQNPWEVSLLKTAVFIDGGHLRVLVRQANREYVPDYIENVALACVEKDEFLLRILYYDCAPYQGNPRLPVSGNRANFQGSDEWLKVLSCSVETDAGSSG